ncbi:MAG: prepilin-type N-terminal cleavage/methylation domain-containing protein [Candidatus Riflebacteria bacterium]|nr:prepilin-type N-terminal cleavage/methylation domain-containing protein [Candidatus Riflebacteria bacterium]
MIKKAFTLIEILIVLTLMSFILMFAYRVFFSQTKMIQDSMEFMRVNDHFRRIISHLGKDFREANHIMFPAPVKWEDVANQQTPAGGGDVLRLIKQEIDPLERFAPVTPQNWNFDKPFDQVIRVRDIVYSLERDPQLGNNNSPRFKLIRSEYLEEKSKPGVKIKQELEVGSSLREFTVIRTIRKPFKAMNISKLSDKIIVPYPSNESGFGSNLIYVRITLERQKAPEKGQAYEISLGTCFYMRGREVFPHQ